MLPEYGRHIHEMVDYLLTIEDREERNSQVRAVIAAMGNLNPVLRDTAEYTHKLWDHLFIMADFKLDVDSPYPIPTAATLFPRPQRLSYPRHGIRRKQYGGNVHKIIRALEKEGDSQAVKEAVDNVARYMRTKSYEYNQEHPNNEMIIKEIREMSENGINIDEQSISNIKSDYKQTFSGHQKKGRQQQNRGNKQNGKNKRNHRQG